MTANPDAIAELKTRNARVDADKAWETSWVRRLIIMVITYLTVLAFMFFYKFSQPFIGACIPVIGYLLSTLTLRGFRKLLKR